MKPSLTSKLLWIGFFQIPYAVVLWLSTFTAGRHGYNFALSIGYRGDAAEFAGAMLGLMVFLSVLALGFIAVAYVLNRPPAADQSEADE